MELLTSNLSKPRHRKATLNGEEYIVVPIRMIVPGVLAGSKGPLYYPRDEIAVNFKQWDGIPVTRFHPTDPQGNGLSAKSPGVIKRQGLGVIRNPRMDNRGLRAEAWLNVTQTRKLAPEILNSVLKNEPVEISTGLFTDNEQAQNGSNYRGRGYTHVARNYRADHLAILPGQVGACSLNDGCGLLANTRTVTLGLGVVNGGPGSGPQGNGGQDKSLKVLESAYKSAHAAERKAWKAVVASETESNDKAHIVAEEKSIATRKEYESHPEYVTPEMARDTLLKEKAGGTKYTGKDLEKLSKLAGKNLYGKSLLHDGVSEIVVTDMKSLKGNDKFINDFEYVFKPSTGKGVEGSSKTFDKSMADKDGRIYTYDATDGAVRIITTNTIDDLEDIEGEKWRDTAGKFTPSGSKGSKGKGGGKDKSNDKKKVEATEKGSAESIDALEKYRAGIQNLGSGVVGNGGPGSGPQGGEGAGSAQPNAHMRDVIISATQKSFQLEVTTTGEKGTILAETRHSVKTKSGKDVGTIVEWNEPKHTTEGGGYERVVSASYKGTNIGSFRSVSDAKRAIATKMVDKKLAKPSKPPVDNEWVTTEKGNKLFIEDGEAKTGPGGKSIGKGKEKESKPEEKSKEGIGSRIGKLFGRGVDAVKGLAKDLKGKSVGKGIKRLLLGPHALGTNRASMITNLGNGVVGNQQDKDLSTGKFLGLGAGNGKGEVHDAAKLGSLTLYDSIVMVEDPTEGDIDDADLQDSGFAAEAEGESVENGGPGSGPQKGGGSSEEKPKIANGPRQRMRASKLQTGDTVHRLSDGKGGYNASYKIESVKPHPTKTNIFLIKFQGDKEYAQIDKSNTYTITRNGRSGQSSVLNEGEPDMAKLTEEERSQVVDNLCTNCSCEKANVFNEEDREVLENMNDEKLVALAEQRDSLAANELVVNTVRKQFKIPKKITLNAMPAALLATQQGKKIPPRQRPEIESSEEAYVDEVDEDTEEEGTVRPRGEDELAMRRSRLSAEDRSTLNWAKQERDRQKQELIEQMTSNMQCGDDEMEETLNELNHMSLERVQKIARLSPPSRRPTRNNGQQQDLPSGQYGSRSSSVPAPLFIGAGAMPVRNRGGISNNSSDASDTLEIPTLNAAELSPLYKKLSSNSQN